MSDTRKVPLTVIVMAEADETDRDAARRVLRAIGAAGIACQLKLSSPSEESEE